MNEFYELVLAFSFCLSVVAALPTTEKSEEDDGLQRIVDVLEKHFNQQKLTSNEQQKLTSNEQQKLTSNEQQKLTSNEQQKLTSNEQQRSNEVEEKGKLCPDNEEDAERQTVHIDGHNEKPNDLCVNKEQEQDDEKDRPPPVVFGIRKFSEREKRNFGISTSRLWTNGVIPYVIDADSFGSRLSKATTLVQETAHNISQTTCVKWRLKTPEDKYFIKFIGNHIGCWSYLGNMSMEGGQPISLSNGCLDAYVILHEMHHAMGGIHEQQRDRRKNFVKINWENIETQFTDQFVLNLHTKNREIYDYRSILQYHLKSFSSSFKKTMTIPDEDLEYLISNPKYSFSFYDIAEVNKAYRCATASCSLTCKNDGFRMQAVDQKTCHCQCPSGLKGTTCEELDTDDDCGETITILNGESRDINLLSYRSGKTCTWLVKAESDSVIRAIVTSIDLPYSARKECYHWLEIRDYLIGDPGKELCGKSATPKTYTQFNIGEGSPLMIRFHSKRDHTPGTGFSITVEAFQSGCMSFPCKTGSTCAEGGGDGSYTCTCKNGLTGTHCDEFKALSQNFCNFEDDFGTCIFDQDTSGASDILWSFNSKLCKTAKEQCLTHGTDYQFLTMTPFYDDVPFDIGSKAIIKTTVKFTANDRCLSFDYAVGTFPSGLPSTQLNVLVEGTGHTKTKLYNVKTTTNYKWQTARVSIESMEDLVISIEGIMGYSFIGVDNIYLRPGSCTICNLNPCKNGGTCEASNSPTGSEYTCSCPEGFSGKMCEIDVCDCQNGGSCVADHVSIGGYTCSCLTGYVGDRCEGKL
ncbi:zinc metalloproteinase dpy-31-like [Saccostrea echinata]|uniref:zinc metalloproteinase dpy-31-like n=1 Tax=Saccostrea echinata TaxID=191078 RepID=UPI002A7F5DB9|nr:zinc metalloproteinase dpy-31-like [Saccostrea echinata]